MPILNDIPTVVVGNFAEAHFDFLSRSDKPAERDDLINGEDQHGDRIILWAGDPKLVIVSYPIAHAHVNTSRLNYPNTSHVAPREPTHFLSSDILREKHLLESVIEYSGANRTVQMIPYATTREFLHLVDVLRRDFNLRVLTPESPDSDHLWVRDYIDTKTGYRSLASYWLPDANKFIPFGFVCCDIKQAAAAAHWFSSRGESCVVKADTGESGIGNAIVVPEADLSVERIFNRLQSDPFYARELIVVERYVPSANRFSPSVEMKVPRLGEGDPHITYISNQLFLGIDFGDFCGIQVDRSVYSQPWYDDLRRCSLELANKLQAMGYVGHFDLDCIVSDENEIYLLEINSRRTGGTHVHEFAKHAFGDDYIKTVSLLSFEAANSGTITDPTELMDVLKDFLFPMPGNEPLGMVVTITTPLPNNRFGYILVASSEEQVIALKERVEKRIRQYCELE
jgi:hypothetical protein